jgi:surface protein
MTSLIFDISTIDLSNSTQYPIKGQEYFTGLTFDKFVVEPIATITIGWTDFSTNSGSGLSFSITDVSYGTAPSINIKQFDGIQLPDMNNINDSSFFGFAGEITAIDTPYIPNNNLVSCFRNATCSNFGSIGNWDISGIELIDYMFDGAINFNGDISGWDTSNVTNMEYMFRNAQSFNGDISLWDTSMVINMSNMFNGATLFNSDISGWVTSNVISLDNFLNNATNFNRDINTSSIYWNVSNVQDMDKLFYGATSFNQSLNNWDLSSVLSSRSMFEGAIQFNGDISGWDTSTITNMNQMFSGATNFNQDISFNFTNMSAFNKNETNFNFLYNTAHDPSQVSRLIKLFNTYTIFTSVDFGIINDYLNNTETSLIFTEFTTSPKLNNITTNPITPDTSIFKSSGYLISNIIYIGYTLPQIENSGYLKADFDSVSVTATDLFNASYSGLTLLNAGYSLVDISSAGYSDDTSLSSVLINGINTYGIILPNGSKSVTIYVETTNPQAGYTISGNNNFKDGQNYVNVTVTAQNDFTVRIYVLSIYVNYPFLPYRINGYYKTIFNGLQFYKSGSLSSGGGGSGVTNYRAKRRRT